MNEFNIDNFENDYKKSSIKNDDAFLTPKTEFNIDQNNEEVKKLLKNNTKNSTSNLEEKQFSKNKKNELIKKEQKEKEIKKENSRSALTKLISSVMASVAVISIVEPETLPVFNGVFSPTTEVVEVLKQKASYQKLEIGENEINFEIKLDNVTDIDTGNYTISIYTEKMALLTSKVITSDTFADKFSNLNDNTNYIITISNQSEVLDLKEVTTKEIKFKVEFAKVEVSFKKLNYELNIKSKNEISTLDLEFVIQDNFGFTYYNNKIDSEIYGGSFDILQFCEYNLVVLLDKVPIKSYQIDAKEPVYVTKLNTRITEDAKEKLLYVQPVINTKFTDYEYVLVEIIADNPTPTFNGVISLIPKANIETDWSLLVKEKPFETDNYIIKVYFSTRHPEDLYYSGTKIKDEVTYYLVYTHSEKIKV